MYSDLLFKGFGFFMTLKLLNIYYVYILIGIQFQDDI